MKSRRYFVYVLLFTVAILDGIITHLTTTSAYPQIIEACDRNTAEVLKCYDSDAECILSQNGSKCVCREEHWMFKGRCQKSDWCAEGEVGDADCKRNGTVCETQKWTRESSMNQFPYKCKCESSSMTSNICSMTAKLCQLKGSKSSRIEGKITLCECDLDSFFDYNTLHCREVDFCGFLECKGKYKTCQGSDCICKTEYTAISNECRPKNYCDMVKNCGEAKCKEGPEDDPKNTRCYCDNGYVLDRKDSVPYCKLVRCETHSLNPCDQVCNYTEDSKGFHCKCFPGHDMKSDDITCEIQASHKCDYNTCPANSVCVKEDGGNKCYCKNGLEKVKTCVDKCTAGLLQDVCPNNCKSTTDGFQCICKGKYKLSSNQVTCEEQNMCAKEAEGFLDCSLKRNRSCEERPETLKGYTCGECLHGLQMYEGVCKNLCQVEIYKATCEEGGAKCAYVVKTPLQIKCKCPPLFTWKKDEGCIFARYSYTTTLRISNTYQHYSKNESLTDGEVRFDWEQVDHDVGKSLLALYGSALSQLNILRCTPDEKSVSPEGKALYVLCIMELQFHFPDYGILQRLNSYRICKGRSSYVPQKICFIPPFLKLVPSSRDTANAEAPFKKSDPCGIHFGKSVCPASTQCVSELVGFSCRCKTGFVVKRSMFLSKDNTGIIEVCQDINECEYGNPCPVGSSCINTIGDFLCPCKPEMFRWNASSNPKTDACTDECGNVTCVHGACEKTIRGFYCRCSSGYSGLFCNETYNVNNSQTGSGKTAVIVVGVLEALGLVGFIAFLFIFRSRFWSNRSIKVKEPKSGSSPVKRDVRSRNIVHLHTVSANNARTTGGQQNGGFQNQDGEGDEAIYADVVLR